MLKHKIQYAFAFAVILFFCSAFTFKNGVWETKTKRTLAELVALFPKAENQSYELPKEVYLLEKKEYLEKVSTNSLTSEYQQYLPYVDAHRLFSRSPNYFHAIAVIETAKNYAFIYRQSQDFSDINYHRFYVSVLSKDGKSVHHEEITKRHYSSDIIAFKINADLELVKYTYERKNLKNVKGEPILKKLEMVDLKIEKPFESDTQELKINPKKSDLSIKNR